MLSGESGKAMTLRLPVVDAEALEVIARANGRSVSVEVREAVESYTAARKADPDFARKARAVANGWAAFADSCGHQ